MEAVRRHPRRPVGFSSAGTAENRQLKDFLWRRLYNHPQILEERDPAVQAVEELFLLYGQHPERLPRPYYEQTQTLPDRQAGLPVHRVACDYIAGMTDTYLFRVHAEQLGPPARETR